MLSMSESESWRYPLVDSLEGHKAMVLLESVLQELIVLKWILVLFFDGTLAFEEMILVPALAGLKAYVLVGSFSFAKGERDYSVVLPATLVEGKVRSVDVKEPLPSEVQPVDFSEFNGKGRDEFVSEGFGTSPLNGNIQAKLNVFYMVLKNRGEADVDHHLFGKMPIRIIFVLVVFKDIEGGDIKESWSCSFCFVIFDNMRGLMMYMFGKSEGSNDIQLYELGSLILETLKQIANLSACLVWPGWCIIEVRDFILKAGEACEGLPQLVVIQLTHKRNISTWLMSLNFLEVGSTDFLVDDKVGKLILLLFRNVGNSRITCPNVDMSDLIDKETMSWATKRNGLVGDYVETNGIATGTKCPPWWYFSDVNCGSDWDLNVVLLSQDDGDVEIDLLVVKLVGKVVFIQLAGYLPRHASADVNYDMADIKLGMVVMHSIPSEDRMTLGCTIKLDVSEDAKVKVREGVNFLDVAGNMSRRTLILRIQGCEPGGSCYFNKFS